MATETPKLDIDAIEALPSLDAMPLEQRTAFVEAVTAQLADVVTEIKAAWKPLVVLAGDPDMALRDRAEAAAVALHDTERLGFRLQATWQLLASICGLEDRTINQIERAAIDEEGREMDAAAND